jgi:hypothetical protein
MYQSVDAVYEHGRIRLKEKPSGIAKTRVLVTFFGAPSEGISHTEKQRHKALRALQDYFSDIPSKRSLVHELMEERKKDFLRE